MTDSPDRPDEPEDSGLPPELEQVLRGLTGGQELDPQMVEMMRGMGLDEVDPQMLQMVAGQVQAMFAGADESGSVDVGVATDIARKTVAAEGDPSIAAAVVAPRPVRPSTSPTSGSTPSPTSTTPASSAAPGAGRSGSRRRCPCGASSSTRSRSASATPWAPP